MWAEEPLDMLSELIAMSQKVPASSQVSPNSDISKRLKLVVRPLYVRMKTGRMDSDIGMRTFKSTELPATIWSRRSALT